MKPNYTYQAELLRVVDGDTLAVVVDLGFHVTYKTRLRLAGVNTPELHSQDAEERGRATLATMALAQHLGGIPISNYEASQLVSGQDLVIKILKPDKYADRWIAEVYRITKDGVEGTSVSSWLLKEGHGVAYSGGQREVYPEYPFEQDQDPGA